MALNKLNTLGGLNTLNTLGGSSSGISDLSVDELLMIAKSRGGSIESIVNELSHPNRSILSTAGSKFKSAFSSFLDTIAIPGQIVAGIISPKFTVEEAIKQNKTVSDAIFGDTNIFDKDGKPTTMEKVGNFIVRLPFDILGDPLTYVSFGAGSGILGIKSLAKLDIGAGVAKELGLLAKWEKAGGVLSKMTSKEGNKILGLMQNIQRSETYQYALKVGKQIDGEINLEKLASHIAKQKEEILGKGILKQAEVDFAENELKALLKETIESPLNLNWSKKAISNLLEHNPALAETLLDKGGIKVFGKTILSGQRIGSVINAVPGMSKLDDITLPLRMSVMAKFDPTIKKFGEEYFRIPESVVQWETALKNMEASQRSKTIKTFQNLEKELGFSEPEINKIYDAAINSLVPSDPRLFSGYKVMKGITKDNEKMLLDTLGTLGKMENHIGSVFVQSDTRHLFGGSRVAKELASEKMAQFARFIAQDTETFKTQIPEIKKILGVVDDIPDNLGIASGAKSVQEVSWKVGEQILNKTDDLIARGYSIEKALADDSVKALYKQQEELGKLIQSAERTGTMEELGLRSELIDDTWVIKDEFENTYKRSQAHAKDLQRNYGYDNIDTNLMTILINKSLVNQKQLMGQHFMEGMIRTFARIEGEPGTDKWTSINSEALSNVAERINKPLLTKDGQQYVFHPAVAKEFEEMLTALGKEDMTGKFWKSFDEIQRYWKASVTSIFPMFHGRNAISNVLQNYLDLGVQAFNPKTNIMSLNMVYNDRRANYLARKMMGTGDDAIQATKEYNTLMSKTMFTDKTGYTWTFGELRAVAKDNDIAFNPNIVGALDVNVDPEKMLTSTLGVGKTKTKKALEAINPLNIDTNLATRLGRETGRTIEDQARMLNFISNLNQTGDVLHAAARTKMFLFDYQNLTKFEKEVMRRLIPFYTWTRKNLELQTKILMTSPGRISNELTLVKSVGEILGGEELTEEEKKLLPPWMANTIALKKKGKEGKTEIISGFGTPIEQPFQALQPNMILGSISPLFRYPVELMTGYQFFQGKNTADVIDAQQFDKAPDVIKDFIGYGKYEGTTKTGEKYTKSYSLRPGNMYMIKNLPFIGRVGNVFGQMTNASTTEQLKLLQLVTGVNVRAYNFEDLEKQQEYKLLQSIQKKMKDAGIVGEFNRFYIRKNVEQVE